MSELELQVSNLSKELLIRPSGKTDPQFQEIVKKMVAQNTQLQEENKASSQAASDNYHEALHFKDQILAMEADYDFKLNTANQMIESLEREVENCQEEIKANEEAEEEIKRFKSVHAAKNVSSMPANPATGAQHFNLEENNPPCEEENGTSRDQAHNVAEGNLRPCGSSSFIPPSLQAKQGATLARDTFSPLPTPHQGGGGDQTPALSNFAESGVGFSGKQVSERILLGGWPQIKGFRSWKIAFMKSVATASKRPDKAYEWILLVEKAKSFDDLYTSGDFAELDALLSVEWDKIITGEFKKKIQIKEIEYAKVGKMVKGRQITWMVYQYFKTTDIDGAMLEWDELIHIEMQGDNVQGFLNAWDSTCLNVNELPDGHFLEAMFKKQLEKSTQLKGALALYQQDITQRGQPKSYDKLRQIVELHLEEQRLKRNQAALSSRGREGYVNASKGGKSGGKGKTKDGKPTKKGECRQWASEGKCSRKAECPWADSHTPENKCKNKPSTSPGIVKRPKSPAPREASVGKEVKPSKGKSPSGETDRPPCRNFLKGKCNNSDCKYWHPPVCKFLKQGHCGQGNKCEYLHPGTAAAAKAEPKSKAKAKAQARVFFDRFGFSLLTKVIKSLRFSKADKTKAFKDRKLPLLQPRRTDFVPHRTDEHGKVVMYDPNEVDSSESNARLRALKLREIVLPEEEVNEETFYVKGSSGKSVIAPKDYPKAATLKVSDEAEGNLEPKQEPEKPSKKVVLSPSSLNARRYIVDSGASFHLVDSRTLSKQERSTIYKISDPISIQTANGDVIVDSKVKIFVRELGLHVWAYLHEDTVAVLSLGMLCDDHGYTYNWKPQTWPTLTKGRQVVTCQPHCNVPFIYTNCLAGGDPTATTETIEEIVADEMKGAEDLIPDVPPPPVPFAGGDPSPSPRKGRQRG